MAECESARYQRSRIPSALEIGIAQDRCPNVSLVLEHLWNARHMARICANARTLSAQSFEGIDMQTRSDATASILEAVAYLESYINEVWQDAADHRPGEDNPRLGTLTPAVIGRLGQLWKNVFDSNERCLFSKRYNSQPRSPDQPPLDAGAEPYQSVHALIKLRNQLMHWKPEIHWGDEERDLENNSSRELA